MFPTSHFFAWSIFNIVRSQIKTKRIFSLTKILINLRRCRLQIKKFTKLIIVSKNWPNDPTVGCKSPSNSIEFTKMSGDIEKELE